MQFVDRTLKCVDCGNEFIFTADEQIFFKQKQFVNNPKHCKRCRARRAPRAGFVVRSETRITCASCGSPTTVPFKPSQHRPVFCRTCFEKQQVSADPSPG